MSHEQTPTIEKFAFQAQEAQMLDNFNTDLTHMGYRAEQFTPEEFQGAIEQKVQAAAADVMRPEVSPALRLTVMTEALAATQNPDAAQRMLTDIESNPLLDEEGRGVVRDMFDTAVRLRQYGGSTPQAEQAIADVVATNLSGVRNLEAQGVNKDSLKITILAFGAGATLRSPHMRGADQLMAVVHKHS